MYVIPAPGFRIPDPAMFNTPDDFLPPEGREVQPSEYWHRLVRDGDVTVQAAEAPPAPQAPQAPAT